MASRRERAVLHERGEAHVGRGENRRLDLRCGHPHRALREPRLCAARPRGGFRRHRRRAAVPRPHPRRRNDLHAHHRRLELDGRTQEMTIATGTKLGRYEIRSQLGKGGMGEVYLAHDTKLDRKVALKILPAEVAAHQDRMRRFVQEAKTASGLNHPNILTIYEIEQIDSVNFIATEFIDGVTLRRRMRNAPMKLREVLDVAVQIASALSAAHAANIVHRDIKPENTMLRRDGIVKVLDFGLAKLTERVPPDSVDTEAPTSFKTDPGTVVGTAIYMSPEQARGLDVDSRTDIFSLGVLIS